MLLINAFLLLVFDFYIFFCSSCNENKSSQEKVVHYTLVGIFYRLINWITDCRKAKYPINVPFRDSCRIFL